MSRLVFDACKMRLGLDCDSKWRSLVSQGRAGQGKATKVELQGKGLATAASLPVWLIP